MMVSFLLLMQREGDNMKCPTCLSNLRKVKVKIYGAMQPVTSYQCTTCDYFSFDPVSSKKVLEELHQTPLRIKQKIVKLSQDRLGIYLNKDLVRSLNLKSGEDIDISIPDTHHIIIALKEKK